MHVNITEPLINHSSDKHKNTLQDSMKLCVSSPRSVHRGVERRSVLLKALHLHNFPCLL